MRIHSQVMNQYLQSVLGNVEEIFITFQDVSVPKKIETAIKRVNRRLNSRREKRYSPSVMVWAGICWNGKSELIFIEKGAKIDAKYYQKNVIRSFIVKDKERLFKGKKFIWHQDSAHSHSANSTVNYLERNKIEFITKDQWIPKSPEAAPTDFFVWGWMKNKLREKVIKTKEQLKREILELWRKLPLKFIRNTLKSWPKKIKDIADAKGEHI